MKVTKEKTENAQAYLTVEMDANEMEVALQEAYRHVVKKANIPGFRKGKAPRDIVERYLGKESLLEDAVNDMLPEAYDKAVHEQNLEPIDQPQIELTQTEPMIFKAVVPLAPVITLGDYHTIAAIPEEAKLSDDAVDKVIEQLRHQNAVWDLVERPIAAGDMVTADIKSEYDGVVFLNRDGVQLLIEPTSNYPAPGFSDQITGLKPNEEKEFKLKMSADYPRKPFADKEVPFKVKINEVKQEKLPEVNDEFVKTVAPDCQDLPALRDMITKNLKTREEERVKLEFDDKVTQSLIDMSKMEFPPVLIERDIDRLLNQQLQYLQASGMNLETYLKALNKTAEQIRADLRPRAEKRVKQSLILTELGKQEKVEVAEADIDTEIETMVNTLPEAQREQTRTQLNTSRDSIKDMLLIRKALERLVEMAKSSYTESKDKEKEAKNEQPAV